MHAYPYTYIFTYIHAHSHTHTYPSTHTHTPNKYVLTPNEKEEKHRILSLLQVDFEETLA